MKLLDRRQTAWALIVGAVLTLAGVVLVGVLLNAAWSTGDISGVLTKAGWFGAAGIPAMVVGGLFFVRVALRRERSGLAAKRVMAGIAALFVLAFLFIEWVPLVRSDNSVDADKVLEQSRQTLKDVDSELERIKSETEEAAAAYEFEARSKQPNTIYSKVVENGFTLEYLVSAEAKEELKPDPDLDELSTDQTDSKETHVVVSLPTKISNSAVRRIG